MLKRSKQKKHIALRVAFLSAAVAIAGISGGIGFTGAQYALAQEAEEDKNGQHYCEEKDGKFVAQEEPCIAKKITDCKPGEANNPCADAAVKSNCNNVNCTDLVTKYVNPGIKVLTGLMGVVVAISIVAAGIQYGSAGSDPGKVAAAKKRLTASIMALLAYLFMFAFLQWLLPGGVL